MNWLIRISGFLLLLITLLPLIPTGKWYVRWWDFPRLQIVFLLMIPLAALAWQFAKSDDRWELSAWAVLLVAAMSWQVSHIIPFSVIWTSEVASAGTDQSMLKIMVANLDYENEGGSTVESELAEEKADVLLLVELDEEWREQLSSLRATYAYHHEELRGEGLGIAVWSRIPILAAETRHLVSDRRASLWTQLKSGSGEIINFIGVHPTPPGLMDSTGETRRDSRVRDAELILIAKEIAERSDEPWIVAGDFNDVAWSHTTRLFKRISGLKDPRVGRSFMGTYFAQYPPCRCPIDHVFLSDGFSLGILDRKRITGSDHFAVLATVALTEPEVGVNPDPEGDDPEEAKEIINEGLEDAENRDVR